MTTAPNTDVSDRVSEARGRILEASLREFSSLGLAGARMDAIAASAQVNKALIYYYFNSKDGLYLATLEYVAGRVRDASLAVMESEASAGKKLLQLALNHFDRILTQREFQTLMQQEMIRMHKGESGALPVLVERVFRPMNECFLQVAAAGMASGELIATDATQMILASLGANVFYFLSAPMWRLMTGEDNFSHEALGKRRRSLVEYLGQAVFQDRELGARMAAEVLAASPMPEKIRLTKGPEER